MNKIINFFIISTLITSYGFLALIAYWLFAPYTVVEYKQQPLKLVETKLKQEEAIQVIHDYCKFQDAELHGIVEIEDSVILQLPTFFSNSMPGCYNRISIPGVVPLLLPVGVKARIHYTISYKVNPIRTIKYHLYTEHFTVVQ